MPVENVPGTDLKYLLLAYDENGRERADGGQTANLAVNTVRDTPVTDVFIFTHGWMGDVPAARQQYVSWIGAMARNTADVGRMKAVRPGFNPLLIGVHWPSLPYGDRNLGTPAAAAAPAPISRETLVAQAAAQTVDTPAAREALRTIFEAARVNSQPAELPPEVREAYLTLDREIGLGSGDPDAAPGEDREPFDPDQAYATAEGGDVASFGLLDDIGNGLLAPLRVLSFWTMKDRARKLGEGEGHRLIASLRAAADAAGRPLKIHLMGHSFGCIVVSAMTAGASAATPAVPVDSIALIQGAFSVWSFTSAIPYGLRGTGYFRRMLDGRVRGPILTTRSSFDSAVGTWYPWAAGTAGQVDFAAPVAPKYSAVGAFGVRGDGVNMVDLNLGPVDTEYHFQPGTVYNFQASQVIKNGSGFAGAHSDFARPEVAHAVWQAAGAVGR